MSSSPLVVLQGEFAVEQSLSSLAGAHILKTPRPLSCIVVAMYNRAKGVGALAHIDDYTDAANTIEKICNFAKDKFEAPCSGEYNAFIMGGTSDPFSVQNKDLITQVLHSLNIKTKIKPLSEDISIRPQITLDVQNGKLRLLKDDQIDQKLEYLQRREYGEFNRWLDAAYAGVNGADIPYFEGKLALRHERDIPEFKANTAQELEQTRRKDQLGQIKLPLRPQRKAISNRDEL